MKNKERSLRILLAGLTIGGAMVACRCTAAPESEKPTSEVTTFNPCDGWNSNNDKTNSLYPGAMAVGDVRVNGKNYYDNGVGEGTIVINNSNQKLDVYGEWGSACVSRKDLDELIEEMFDQGCGDKNGCKTLRIVTFDENQVDEMLIEQK